MIYSTRNSVTLNEAGGFVDKNDVPEAFKKLALDLIKTAEELSGKRIKGGVNEKISDALNVAFFGNKAYEKIEEKAPATSYYFRMNTKINLGFATSSEYIKLMDDIMKKIGMKKSKVVFEINSESEENHYYYKEGKTKSGKPCIFAAWSIKLQSLPGVGWSLTFVLQCVTKEQAKKVGLVESDSISSLDEEFFDPTEESIVAHGLEKVATTPEELYGVELWSVQDSDKPDDAFGDSQDVPSPKYEGYINPKVSAAFTELLDMTNRSNRRGVLALNEEQSNTVLTALTSKLYDYIVSKVDEIDYGEIPETKGDVTKLSNYDKLRDCIVVLKDILKEYRQDTAPIDIISEALANLETRKDLFLRAFKTNVEVPVIVYNNTVLAVLESVSYMIATSIEFIKTPNTESFALVLDKVGYAKTKNCMLYNTLKKFNHSCKSGEMDKALNYIIDHKMKGYQEGAVGVLAAVTTGVLAVLMIIPIIREMVFLFYYVRMRVSEFFDMQADLLQMNAHNLEQNKEIDKTERDKITSKQMGIVKRFREISNKIAFTVKKAEVNTSKEIEVSTKAMNLKDISDSVPSEVSALF